MKVLLVDDHALLRDGIALLMANEFPDLDLLQAGTLAEARAAIGRHDDIRLVLLDLTLPDGSGLAELPWFAEAAPQARLVALSADESKETVLGAISAGAAGYVPKSVQSGAMLEALRNVLDGGVHLPEAVTDRRATPRPDSPARVPKPLGPEDLGFSPRQADVLRMLIDGKPNKAISRELEMSESTVKTHLAAIFRKLEANSRTQAVVAAARLGLRLGTEDALSLKPR
ncbi:MAG TPA: response regulator transcription factor [Burkholderiaceae bacterium]|nr:response regulator transcription factor [Burkholderiaceae bacterium]